MDYRVTARIGEHGYRTEIEAGGHTIIADEPIAEGGTDQGPTPYDLLASAVGACTAMTLRMYADRKKWPLQGVTVHLRHGRNYAADDRDCEDAPVRMDAIERRVEFEGPLSEEQKQRLIEIADRCPLHRTLEAGVKIV